MQVHATMMNAKVVFRLSRTSLVHPYCVVNKGSERCIERRALARQLDVKGSVFSRVGYSIPNETLSCWLPPVGEGGLNHIVSIKA